MARDKTFSIGGNPENFPASKKTMYLLHMASHGEHHYSNPKHLTQGQAYQLIGKFQRKMKARLEINTVLSDAYFESVFWKAVESANNAGGRWIDGNKAKKAKWFIYHEDTDYEEPIIGRIGDVYIKYDAKSLFTDWLKHQLKELTLGSRIIIPHDYLDRREFDLLRACEDAAMKTLLNLGIKGFILIENPA